MEKVYFYWTVLFRSLLIVKQTRRNSWYKKKYFNCCQAIGDSSLLLIDVKRMTSNIVKYILAFSCCDFFVVLRKVSFNTLVKIYARAIWSGSSKKHLSRLVTKYTIAHPNLSRTLQKKSFISIYKLQYTTLVLYYYSLAVLTRLQNSHLKFKSLIINSQLSITNRWCKAIHRCPLQWSTISCAVVVASW